MRLYSDIGGLVAQLLCSHDGHTRVDNVRRKAHCYINNIVIDRAIRQVAVSIIDIEIEGVRSQSGSVYYM